MLYTILTIVVIISIFLIFIVLIHNKYQFAIIKIEEAENNIDMLLNKKLELLKRSSGIIKKELKLDSFLDDLDVDHEYTNLFNLNDILKNSSSAFYKILDENDKLFKSETLNCLLKEISDNELELAAAIKYYNNSVISFNKLVSIFPSNIYAFFKRYKKKSFYDDEDLEIFDILNNR